MMSTATTAEVREMSNEEYHAQTDWISNSMLKDFSECRRLYEAKYIAKTLKPERKDAFDLGGVAHTAILEPQDISSVCMEIPQEVLSKSGAKSGNAWKQFAEENGDKILLKADQVKQVVAMRDAVFRDEAARMFLEADGPTERSIFWTCPYTGLKRRCKPDKLSLIDGKRYSPDLKTCANPSPRWFAKACFNFGYIFQQAFYSDGIEELYGARPIFPFIAVGTSPPHVCRVYDLDEKAVAFGEVAVIDRLNELRDCLEKNDWRNPGEGEVTTISLANWAYYQDDWRMK